MSDLGDAALGLAARGWHVFPCRAKGKAPLTRRGHHDATTDPAQIATWWEEHPNANIGLALKPSKLAVLDVDITDTKDGLASLRAWVAEHGIDKLPPTLRAKTGGGGYHFVFARTDDSQARRVIGFAPGLDYLGDGYIVAPPSVHQTGKAYEWEGDPTHHLAPLFAELAGVKPAAPTAPPSAAAGQTGIIAPGGRNAALTAIGGRLRHMGLPVETIVQTLEFENQRLCKPPLDDLEVGRIAASVGRYKPDPTADPVSGLILQNTFLQAEPAAFAKCVEIDAPPESGMTGTVVDSGGGAWLSDVADSDRPPVRLYATGFPKLDEALGGGAATRQLFVLASPPATGKTGWGVTVALHIARTAEDGAPVLYVSTELERQELLARFGAQLADGDVAHREFVRGEVPIDVVKPKLADLPIRVLGCEDLSIEGDESLRIIARTVEWLREHSEVPPIVIIDYMQDLTRGNGGDTEKRGRVGGMARALRVLSQVYDCAVIAISSVSRAYYGRAKADALRDCDDARVYLAAAKADGDVDFDAGVVLFLDVDSDSSKGYRDARIAIAKARHGDDGIFVGVRFHGKSGKWEACPEAVVAMSADAKEQRTQDLNIDRLKGLVYAKVSELTLADGLVDLSTLKCLVTGKEAHVSAAARSMIADGSLIIKDVWATNANGSMRKKEVLGLPDVAAASECSEKAAAKARGDAPADAGPSVSDMVGSVLADIEGK